jgi:hypothetical protein
VRHASNSQKGQHVDFLVVRLFLKSQIWQTFGIIYRSILNYATLLLFNFFDWLIYMSLSNVVPQNIVAQKESARKRNPITKFEKRSARYSFMGDDDKFSFTPRININRFVQKKTKKNQLNPLTTTRRHPSSRSMNRNILIGGKRLRRTYKKRQ